MTKHRYKSLTTNMFQNKIFNTNVLRMKFIVSSGSDESVDMKKEVKSEKSKN